ncbi:TPA: hypothetical protein ACIUI9_002220 [Salmonella enterica subsp. enterica serovar 13,23:b:-]
MKNTTPDAAVLQELKELTSRIFKICEQNNMPVVIGYSYELSRNEDDGYTRPLPPVPEVTRSRRIHTRCRPPEKLRPAATLPY